jgi:tetratricopeptide (TPR) repeat protein
MSSPAVELPRSLQELIADARRSLERWESEPADEPDEILEGVKEWTARLAHGEYEEDLYWECVAEDCERGGDFRGAIAAYERILGLPEQGGVRRMKALSGLATLHELLGDDRRALAYLRAAVKDEQADPSTESGIFLRLCLYAEARHQVRRGRVRAARRLIRRGCASFEEGHDDYLCYAKLQIAWAECEVAAGHVAGADEALKEAREALEQYAEWLNPPGAETGLASGVEAGYAEWWSAEARRRRLTGEPATEVEAWQKALSHLRRGCQGWDNLAWNAAIAKTLQKLADAAERHGQAEAASRARAEGEVIGKRWHLPNGVGADDRKANRWSLGRLFGCGT